MKTGFDAKRAFLNSSGLGNYSRNTLNALYRYFPENEYILFTPEIKDTLFKEHNNFKTIAPENFISKKFSSVWRSFFLSGSLKRHGIKLFHGLSNELPRGIHKTGISSVVTIHDLIFMRFPEFYNPADRNIYVKKVKYACSSADKVIAISKQTKSDIETFFGVPSEKIELIYQPVSQVFFDKQDGENIRKKYNLPEKYILSVGTIEPRKNQKALLQAIHTAKIGETVIFVGKQTAMTEELKLFAEEKKMAKQVIFLSNIPEADLSALYQSALFSVYISVFEGFGLPVIESMAAGCPVITSSVSVLPETAGGAALLCNPSEVLEISEKLLLFTKNETFRNEFREKGIQRAAQFHPKNYAGRLISLYSEILNKHEQ